MWKNAKAATENELRMREIARILHGADRAEARQGWGDRAVLALSAVCLSLLVAAVVAAL